MCIKAKHNRMNDGYTDDGRYEMAVRSLLLRWNGGVDEGPVPVLTAARVARWNSDDHRLLL